MPLPDDKYYDASTFKDVYPKLTEMEKKMKEIDTLKEKMQLIQASQSFQKEGSAPPVYRPGPQSGSKKIIPTQPNPGLQTEVQDTDPNKLIDPAKAGIPVRLNSPGINVYLPNSVIKHYEKAKGKYAFNGTIEQYIGMIDYDFWIEREKKRGWE